MKWIKTDDRLPKESGRYLITYWRLKNDTGAEAEIELSDYDINKEDYLEESGVIMGLYNKLQNIWIFNNELVEEMILNDGWDSSLNITGRETYVVNACFKEKEIRNRVNQYNNESVDINFVVAWMELPEEYLEE